MTIHEIAQEAGVSIATVSRVLNNGPVSPDKKAKVEAVIAKHRFTPSLQARGLVNRQSEAIGGYKSVQRPTLMFDGNINPAGLSLDLVFDHDVTEHSRSGEHFGNRFAQRGVH